MFPLFPTDSSKAAAIIKQGRLVAFPTGTSYGLAADALQGFALQRLRNLKGRPGKKSFSVFMRDALWDKHLSLTAAEQAVCREFAGRPLTVLVKPRSSLSHLARDGRIGLRLVDHPLMDQLALSVDVPLTATSANRSGESPCFSPACVRVAFPNPLPDDRLGEADPRGASQTTYDLSLGAILDGGELPRSLPSTIARITNGRVHIIRPGALPREAIEAALSQV